MNHRVLIVDDNDHVRWKIRRILAPYNCDFFEAETAEEALTLIRKHAFDVVFLDISLPFGLTGIDVLRKAREIRSDLGNVIFLTGWMEDATRAEADDLGAYGWLDKAPFDRKKIIAMFQSAMAPAGGDSR